MASGEKKRIGGKVVYVRKAQRTPPATAKPPERKPENFKSASEAENLAELHDYMTARNQVWVDYGSLEKLDFKSVRTAASEMEYIMNEFPQAKGAFDTLQGENGAGYAAASLSGKISLRSKYFSSDDTLQERYKNDLSTNFHPAGTTGNNVVTHESGHLLEAALIRRANNNMETAYDHIAAVSDWRNGTFAKQIVSEAAKAAKKAPDGKGKRNAQLISDVSGYAKTNRSETLAECVADYRANGANSKPLSREVWKILKRELG